MPCKLPMSSMLELGMDGSARLGLDIILLRVFPLTSKWHCHLFKLVVWFCCAGIQDDQMLQDDQDDQGSN